ncbi:hypothetical protein KHS38_17825 [Mucilaginibacter sp. Bleaf8]|uniref:DUF2975 domain-containing protein n=1 Tax=Mucilaginibacter sp. Bleaf8 TaxID=2834430 RepID=UPI001BD04C49|nr:DUF2975 domain-containing protein [Mucilaginibacter sp. Bleaf8]MBS7566272.1 hypothetical protein [Mucilaginibacter sp. Bleaf8]
MKTQTANRIITFIWVIIALSAVKSTITLITSGLHYTAQPSVFWLAVINLAIALTLLSMSFHMRRMVKGYTTDNNWPETNYRSMKRMGYLALLLVFMHTLFQIGYDYISALLSKQADPLNGLFIFRRFYAILFTESPIVWVLALTIFLFAELLKTAHFIKAENESII